MDTLLTTGDLARKLGATIPRVHRAVKAGIIAPVNYTANGRLLFDSGAEVALRARWGSVAPIVGLSRGETQVLAALARRPNGLRSSRAVARAAGVSPTTAGRALLSLRQRNLIQHRRLLVAEGRIREVDNWSVRWRSGEWRQIAPVVHRIELPVSPHPPTRLPRRLPRRMWHLFWDVNPASTDLRRYATFVVTRILENGDARAIAWLVRTFPPDMLRAVARRPGRVNAQVRRLATVLAGGSDERTGYPAGADTTDLAADRPDRPA